MSPAAFSVFVFGIYLASGGLMLLLAPEELCHFLGLSPPGDPLWVRLNGMFFLDLAFYCIKAAIDGHKAFIRWSVTTRPLTLLFLGAFAILGFVSPNILIFGVIDVFASLWTALALREGRLAEAQARPRHPPAGAVEDVSWAARGARMTGIGPTRSPKKCRCCGHLPGSSLSDPAL
jgi:hypothetical protein